ncbi:MAG: xanthine dehydrogenase family protein subunit M [Rhodocyclaceae bacterium]|nr:xanthine dehydrogenase family protein subunit M [Rhodocyclaceae bacterium]
MTALDNYVAPTSLEQAVVQLQELGEVTILAGGTDLMPQSHAGRVKFKRTLMNIRRIPELRGISREGDEIRIGALTTITEMMAHPLVREHLPLLAQAADHFASDQIRNAGTVGGNICNASPAGDTLVPLMVLGAHVELASKPDDTLFRRSMPLPEFFVGPGKTRLAPAELLTAVRIPIPPKGFVARFHKFGTRPALDISAISIGVAGVLKDGKLSQVRVAFGAVAPTPVCGCATEEALEGKKLDAATIAAAAKAAQDEVHPISDVRASAWYRKEMIHNMTRRILEDVSANH